MGHNSSSKRLRQLMGGVVCRGGSPEAQRRGFAGTARAGGLSPASAKGQTPGRQAGVRRKAGRVHAQLRSGSRSA